MTKSPTNSQVFLNESSIEAARDKYLKYEHLPSIQNAWDSGKGYKRPTVAQFKKRFGAAYIKRQNWLAKNGVSTAVVEPETEDRIDRLERLLTQLVGGEQETPEVNLGVVDDEIEPPKEPVVKMVKAENFDELPRSGQLYFFLHRAKEAGHAYAIVPLRRGIAAECISQMKDDGRTYQSVTSALLKK